MGEDLKFTIKKKDLEKFLKPEYLVIAFFILASGLYINFDKLPLTHPGNLKASDTFAHSLAVEKVIDTKQWNYDDFYLSAGISNMSTVQPPLYYTNAAILTMFSGIPAWATFYLLVCLSQAFFVLLVYLITKEIFDNEKISILAAGLTILPLPVSIWLYPTYIGIWIQVCGYSVMLLYFWLFLRYFRTKEPWTLLFMGISIVSLIMTHTADIYMLFLPSLFIGFSLLFDYFKNKDFPKLVKKSLLFGLIPFVVMLALLPKFLFVWRGYSNPDGASYLPGFFKSETSMFDPVNAVANQVFPHFSNIPLWQFIFIGIGIIALIAFRFYPYAFSIETNKNTKLVGKKTSSFSLGWLYFVIYFFIFLYYCEYFLHKPYYIGRMRALQPYLLYPFLAYGIYIVMKASAVLISAVSINSSENKKKASAFFEKNSNIFDYIVVFAILFFLVFSAYPSYKSNVDMMRYEHVSLGQWEAYKFIQKDSTKDDKVLFFGSHDQSEGLYVKRVNGIFAHVHFQNYLERISDTNVPLEFEISGWGGSTPRSNIIELNWWKYQRVPDPSSNVSIYDFKYIFFMDERPGMKEMNDFFIYKFSEAGFNLVYNKNGYRVLRK